jgi:hypothetical protein
MWTQTQINHDLPRIRKLKGIAYAGQDSRGRLLVTTKFGMLMHTKSILPLAKIRMRFPDGSNGRVHLRYWNPIVSILHWHPTMLTRIGTGDWAMRCLGGYEDELREAYRQGPLMAVLLLLAMLQQIQPEEKGDWVIEWAASLTIMFGLACIGTLIYSLFYVIIN